MSKDDVVLTVREAGELLGMSRQGVHKRLRQGRIKARRVGKDYRFSRPALLDATGPLDGQKACAFLKITRATLKQLRDRGEIPSRKGGRAYLYSRRELLAWLAGEEVQKRP